MPEKVSAIDVRQRIGDMLNRICFLWSDKSHGIAASLLLFSCTTPGDHHARSTKDQDGRDDG